VAAAAVLAALLSLIGIPARSVCQRITPAALAIGVLGGAGFISLKCLSMSKAASAASIRLSPIAPLGLFTQGVVIELVTWPGKAWADGFRTMRLRKVAGISLVRAAAVVLTARAGAVAASAAMITIAAGLSLMEGRWNDESRGWAPLAVAGAAAGIAVAVVVWSTRYRHAGRSLPVNPLALIEMSLAAGAAAIIDVVACSLICQQICGTDPWLVAPGYVLLTGIAAATSLPLGAGVLDAGLFALLTSRLGAEHENALAAVLCCRLCGPGLTLLVGGLLLGLVGASGRTAMPIGTISGQSQESSRRAA
jgi:hypothetical protein